MNDNLNQNNEVNNAQPAPVQAPVTNETTPHVETNVQPAVTATESGNQAPVPKKKSNIALVIILSVVIVIVVLFIAIILIFDGDNTDGEPTDTNNGLIEIDNTVTNFKIGESYEVDPGLFVTIPGEVEVNGGSGAFKNVSNVFIKMNFKNTNSEKHIINSATGSTNQEEFEKNISFDIFYKINNGEEQQGMVCSVSYDENKNYIDASNDIYVDGNSEKSFYGNCMVTIENENDVITVTAIKITTSKYTFGGKYGLVYLK